MFFKLLDLLEMWWDRKYFCKEELKNKKCDPLHKSCCMHKNTCKL